MQNIGYLYGDEAVEGQKTGLIYGVTLNNLQKIGYSYDDLVRLSTRSISTDIPYVTEYTYLEGATPNTTTMLVKTIKNGNDIYEYTYDALGNIITVSKNGGIPEQYSYDELNQLSTVVSGDDVYQYSYDNGGNITEVKKNNEVIKSYAYENSEWKDLLTSYNGETIVYDEIGNPLSYRNSTSFIWQNGRQLTNVYRDETPIASYIYNADGLRTSKSVYDITTEYYWMNGMLHGQKTGDEYLLFLYDETGKAYGFVKKNVSTEETYYYEFNLQGDIIGIIDSTGTKVVEYTYDVWGNILSVTGTLADTIGQKNPLRYRGYYYDDETGFYLTGTRYYDPEIGRFLNADSVMAGIGEVQGYNLFAYCMNNPISMSDPTGNWPKWVGSIGSAIKSAVSTAVKYAKKVKDSISEVCGVSINVDKEQPASTQYYFWMTTESGAGYNKSFDTGKPVNLYKTVANNPLNFWKGGEGIDINIDGYGIGLQIGNEKNVSLHLKNSTLEFGQNALGRSYVKHSYVDSTGMYMYNKFTVNNLEIGATVLLAIYAPSIVLAGTSGATAISIFK